jgi:hypothetical protein
MSTKDELFEMARNVASRSDLVAFIEVLSVEYRARGDQWENNRLELYLNGLAGFTNDIGGYYRNMGETADPNNVTWRMVAEMLLAATLYE